MSVFRVALMQIALADKRDEDFVDNVIGLLRGVEITEIEHIQGEQRIVVASAWRMCMLAHSCRRVQRLHLRGSSQWRQTNIYEEII